MLVCQNVKGVHGQRKVGNPRSRGKKILQQCSTTYFFR